MADTARDPQALEREIERTRAELARPVDALVDRVNPKTAARRSVMMLKEAVDAIDVPGGGAGEVAGSGQSGPLPETLNP